MARSGPGKVSGLPRNLSAGRLSPVYLLYGDEAFRKEEAAGAIRRAAGEGAGEGADWNLTVLDGGTTRLAEILDAARTLPMLGSRRLILVKDAGALRENDPEPLKEYLKDPTPTSCIVFLIGSAKPDFRRSLFKTLQQQADAVEFRPLRGAAVSRWVRERARKRGVEIEPEAAALLEEHLGNELARIDQEIGKAADFVGSARRIRPSDLAETLGAAAVGSVFDLAEKVGAGETGEAIRLLRALLADGEEPVRLLPLIARQIRILVLGKALLAKGVQGRDLAVALGLPPYPFILEKTRRLIERFPEEIGADALRRIREADRALKGGRGKDPAVLEGLVLDLAGRAGRLARRGGAVP